MMRNRPFLNFFPGDILDPPGGGGGTPTPEPEPAPRRRGYVTCDHCGCQLTQGGEVFKMSDTAKAQNKQAEKIAELNGRIAEQAAEIERLKTLAAPAAREHFSII